MGDITTDNGIMAALGRQMSRAVQRQMVAAGNLANAETPGYRAREVNFADALDEQINAAATNGAHFQAGDARTGAVVREIDDVAARRDGNTVQVDQELLKLGRAGGDFAAAQTALSAKFRLVRYAINEGK
ncbi:MAG TPA: flagellar basal body rod protein FlgB [Vicinamibacterales bacterium]|nr:flagellar basal body rod protein FlgB [Vicinamibacterales bacterium]